MAIAPSDVKSLRDRTNAPMMECKAALVEAGGDLDKAIDGQTSEASVYEARGDLLRDASDLAGAIAVRENQSFHSRHRVRSVAPTSLTRRIRSIGLSLNRKLFT